MKIIVYSRNFCAWCDDVKNFLKKNNIEFEERDIAKNKEYLDEMVKKSGQQFVPTIDIDGEILADADAKAVEKLLKQKKHY
ncbi:glutaredoxin family protein [Patescibacteria group bacterium]|nr:MAG: glutaredoxin family protein [Patescibacteria group bacterium]